MTTVPTRAPGAGRWTPSRGARMALGLLAGFGATGLAAGLGLIGTFLDVDLPLVDPSAVIVMAPVIVVPAFAGAVLRGWAAVASIMAGAVASPIAVILTLDGSCPWAPLGMASAAVFVLVAAGAAAFYGAQAGGSDWLERNRRRAVAALIVIAAIGVVAWIVARVTIFAGECR